MENVTKISREEANKIIEDHLHLPHQKVVICYKGEWYDIRKLNEEEIKDFITRLIISK